MPLVPALRRASVAVILFLGASAVQASVAFHVTVTTERVNQPGVKTSLPARDTQDSDVVLGPHYLSVRDGKSLSVLDFATRRHHVIDTAASTYDTYSLFDVAGFRRFEIEHRKGMAGALEAGGLQAHVTPLVYEEQALSVPAARRRNALQPQVLDGAVLWSLDGQPLLRLDIAGSPSSRDDATAFAQYVRYTWGGHPAVLKMLADGKRIPADFTLHYQEVGGKVTRHFRISAMTAGAPATYTLSAYRPRPLAADAPALERVLAQAALLPPPGPQVHPALRAEAEKLFAADKPFEAFLSMLDDHFSTGALVDKLSPQQQLAMQACQPIHDLTRALLAKDKEGIAAALASVQELRKQTGLEQPVLALFEGNLRAKLGQWPEATALYLQVLQEKPQMAAVYQDLGDALLAQFDAPNAWRSWDAGRAMAPTLRQFRKVNDLERSLLHDYPAFFTGGVTLAPDVQPSTSRPASKTKTVGSTNLP
ncbi:tetratricopeptide repeat protein [Janthinobacterium sp. PAMC25594]|uniref:tetratricopeptide repeat protein n=1 Tax=Janthinobacterium sp. PAMC25594 TaxID=2861284 RepID=UPI001C62BA71|nr:tetratricopeptide repeat protein [Janthinobacterium sp. PAMC25594]QYG05090.1 tetratricopeptide repeat protein [Janthinobacterium sp. PAMC25594]